MAPSAHSIIFVVAIATIPLVSGCIVADGPWSMEKIMFHQDIIVYGKETARHNVTDSSGQLQRIDATFEVFCVLKNKIPTTPVPKTITLYQVSPDSTCIETQFQYVTNQEILLGLKQRDDGTYQWHEPHPTDGAAFDATQENLDKAAHFCGVNVLAPPAGVTDNKCPSAVLASSCPETWVDSGSSTHSEMGIDSGSSTHSVMGILIISGLLALIFTN